MLSENEEARRLWNWMKLKRMGLFYHPGCCKWGISENEKYPEKYFNTADEAIEILKNKMNSEIID